MLKGIKISKESSTAEDLLATDTIKRKWKKDKPKEQPLDPKVMSAKACEAFLSGDIDLFNQLQASLEKLKVKTLMSEEKSELEKSQKETEADPLLDDVSGGGDADFLQDKLNSA